MPLVGGGAMSGRDQRGRGRRGRKYDPYDVVAAPKPRCTAKILKPQASMIDGSSSESYEQCGAPQIKDDILCSAHRRLVNLSALSDGVRTGNSSNVVMVPLKAYEKSKFRLGYLHINQEESKKAADDAMIDIWNPKDVQETARFLLMGKK